MTTRRGRATASADAAGPSQDGASVGTIEGRVRLPLAVARRVRSRLFLEGRTVADVLRDALAPYMEEEGARVTRR